MKVLWLTNLLTPMVAEQIGCSFSYGGGWIVGAYIELIKNEEVEIFSCCLYEKKIEKTEFCTFLNNEDNKNYFAEVLKKVKPEIIHIFGTEFKHTYDMVMAAEQCGVLDRVVINIQGLVSIYHYYYYYYANLPYKIVKRYTFRDFLKHDNIVNQCRNFGKRGVWEIKALEKVRHVIGRTDWDRACVERVNPRVQYHFCNETLRPAFYRDAGKWSAENCEKHSIFVSQCSYPIKGFHYALEGMVDVIKKYPDAHLYTTGRNPLELSFREKLRISSYQKYIGELLVKYHLEEHVTFLGSLSEEQMCERYLKSNVFLSPSSIENSPNSLGEAMLLGVPCVASDVGGIKNMMEHEKEGYVYQADAPYMMAYYIGKVFEGMNRTVIMGKNGYTHASITHNPNNNCSRLLGIYDEIIR